MIKRKLLVSILAGLVSLAGLVWLVAARPSPNSAESMTGIGFRTPLMSDYVPSIAVVGFRTPPMSDYVPSISVTGFRTPPMSDYKP